MLHLAAEGAGFASIYNVWCAFCTAWDWRMAEFFNLGKRKASTPLAAGLRTMEFSWGYHLALLSAVVICSTNWLVLETQLCSCCPLTITSEHWWLSSLVVKELGSQIIRLAHHYLMPSGRGAQSGIWSSYKEYEFFLIIWCIIECPWEMAPWLRGLQI